MGLELISVRWVCAEYKRNTVAGNQLVSIPIQWGLKDSYRNGETCFEDFDGQYVRSFNKPHSMGLEIDMALNTTALVIYESPYRVSFNKPHSMGLIEILTRLSQQ